MAQGLPQRKRYCDSSVIDHPRLKFPPWITGVSQKERTDSEETSVTCTLWTHSDGFVLFSDTITTAYCFCDCHDAVNYVMLMQQLVQIYARCRSFGLFLFIFFLKFRMLGLIKAETFCRKFAELSLEW